MDTPPSCGLLPIWKYVSDAVAIECDLKYIYLPICISFQHASGSRCLSITLVGLLMVINVHWVWHLNSPCRTYLCRPYINIKYLYIYF